MRSAAAVLVAAVLAGLVAACDLDATQSLGAARELVGSGGTDAPRVATAVPPIPAGPGFAASGEVDAYLVRLEGLEVSERGSPIEYNRRDWRHWVDADRDCQNTRAEVLIAESVTPVSFVPEDDGDKCRVNSGQWVGPWTGEVFTDASDVDIDHHVPLGHAHLSGGWEWPPERRRAYANDLDNPNSLQATGARLNRSKGKKPPDEWLPDETAAWCRYAADWISVKEQWDLTVTAAEVGALEDMLRTCDDGSSWGLAGPPGP